LVRVGNQTIDLKVLYIYIYESNTNFSATERCQTAE